MSGRWRNTWIAKCVHILPRLVRGYRNAESQRVHREPVKVCEERDRGGGGGGGGEECTETEVGNRSQISSEKREEGNFAVPSVKG